MRIRDAALAERGVWVWMLILLMAKLVLVSDVAVHIRFSPFDDNLYVNRAYALLAGDAWGGYDAYTLAKLPGISLWLAASRIFGVPYLLGINVLYGLAGIYLLRGASLAGVSHRVLLLAYTAYLLNPVTFSVGWALVMREALSSVLTVAMLGASLHVLLAPRKRIPWAPVVLLAALFAFSLLLREEDRLLWAYLVLFAVSFAWIRHSPDDGRVDKLLVIVVLLIPALAAGASTYGFRAYNQVHYGAPLLTDFGEGEFPKLMARIRSVESPLDNRLVMLPQDVLKRLSILIPEFAPVVAKLPPPGRQTFSCRSQGVCTEWSNGWMLWYVKQAASESGLTPTLADGQAYFRAVRERLDKLCASGALVCRTKGDGIMPPMEFRWFRAYELEARKLFDMLLFPRLDLIAGDAEPVTGATSLVRTYQAVTMTSVTAPSVHSGDAGFLPYPGYRVLFGEWRGTLALLDGVLIAIIIVTASGALIWRWTLYPQVPLSPLFALSAVFWIYSVARVLSLAYVAVFFGPFEPRIVFSTYTGLAIMAWLAIWDCLRARKESMLTRA